MSDKSSEEEIKRLREKCSYQRRKILELQKELGKYKHFNQWESIEHFEDWSDRSKAMSSLIVPDCSSILDLGCGEGSIRRFISPEIKYYGCDYKKRDDNTIICDLATSQFPDIFADCIFIAGVLEYLTNWKEVLLKCCSHCRQIVLSYSSIEESPERNPLWVNCISEKEIISTVESGGFKLAKKCLLPYRSVGFSFVRK